MNSDFGIRQQQADEPFKSETKSETSREAEDSVFLSNSDALKIEKITFRRIHQSRSPTPSRRRIITEDKTRTSTRSETPKAFRRVMSHSTDFDQRDATDSSSKNESPGSSQRRFGVAYSTSDPDHKLPPGPLYKSESPRSTQRDFGVGSIVPDFNQGASLRRIFRHKSPGSLQRRFDVSSSASDTEHSMSPGRLCKSETPIQRRFGAASSASDQEHTMSPERICKSESPISTFRRFGVVEGLNELEPKESPGRIFRHVSPGSLQKRFGAASSASESEQQETPRRIFMRESPRSIQRRFGVASSASDSEQTPRRIFIRESPGSIQRRFGVASSASDSEQTPRRIFRHVSPGSIQRRYGASSSTSDSEPRLLPRQLYRSESPNTLQSSSRATNSTSESELTVSPRRIVKAESPLSSHRRIKVYTPSPAPSGSETELTSPTQYSRLTDTPQTLPTTNQPDVPSNLHEQSQSESSKKSHGVFKRISPKIMRRNHSKHSGKGKELSNSQTNPSFQQESPPVPSPQENTGSNCDNERNSESKKPLRIAPLPLESIRNRPEGVQERSIHKRESSFQKARSVLNIFSPRSENPSRNKSVFYSVSPRIVFSYPLEISKMTKSNSSTFKKGLEFIFQDWKKELMQTADAIRTVTQIEIHIRECFQTAIDAFLPSLKKMKKFNDVKIQKFITAQLRTVCIRMQRGEVILLPILQNLHLLNQRVSAFIYSMNRVNQFVVNLLQTLNELLSIANTRFSPVSHSSSDDKRNCNLKKFLSIVNGEIDDQVRKVVLKGISPIQQFAEDVLILMQKWCDTDSSVLIKQSIQKQQRLRIGEELIPFQKHHWYQTEHSKFKIEQIRTIEIVRCLIPEDVILFNKILINGKNFSEKVVLNSFENDKKSDREIQKNVFFNFLSEIYLAAGETFSPSEIEYQVEVLISLSEIDWNRVNMNLEKNDFKWKALETALPKNIFDIKSLKKKTSLKQLNGDVEHLLGSCLIPGFSVLKLLTNSCWGMSHKMICDIFSGITTFPLDVKIQQGTTLDMKILSLTDYSVTLRKKYLIMKEYPMKKRSKRRYTIPTKKIADVHFSWTMSPYYGKEKKSWQGLLRLDRPVFYSNVSNQTRFKVLKALVEYEGRESFDESENGQETPSVGITFRQRRPSQKISRKPSK